MRQGSRSKGIARPLGFALSLSLLGCAAMSRGYIYRIDGEAVGDSTYIYGYAVVGTQSRFQMVFENEDTKERKTYLKQWVENGIYKEHLFAFSFPKGIWKIAEIRTDQESHQDYTRGRKKIVEIKEGLGNFIGKIDALDYPLSETQFESVQVIRDKEKTDRLMKERFPNFDAGRTIPVEFRR